MAWLSDHLNWIIEFGAGSYEFEQTKIHFFLYKQLDFRPRPGKLFKQILILLFSVPYPTLNYVLKLLLTVDASFLYNCFEKTLKFSMILQKCCYEISGR